MVTKNEKDEKNEINDCDMLYHYFIFQITCKYCNPSDLFLFFWVFLLTC